MPWRRGREDRSPRLVPVSFGKGGLPNPLTEASPARSQKKNRTACYPRLVRHQKQKQLRIKRKTSLSTFFLRRMPSPLRPPPPAAAPQAEPEPKPSCSPSPLPTVAQKGMERPIVSSAGGKPTAAPTTPPSAEPQLAPEQRLQESSARKRDGGFQ